MANAALISQMPGKRTNREYEMQGWNAALAGFGIDDCPYYATSAAERLWKKGYRSA